MLFPVSRVFVFVILGKTQSLDFLDEEKNARSSKSQATAEQQKRRLFQ